MSHKEIPNIGLIPLGERLVKGESWRARRMSRVLLLLAGGVVVCVGVVSSTSCEVVSTKTTYSEENATNPCDLIDVSVLQRWSGDVSTTRNTVGDPLRICTVSSGAAAGSKSASIRISAAMHSSNSSADTAHKKIENLFRGDGAGKTIEKVPNRGKDAFSVLYVGGFVAGTWVDYKIDVLDDNLELAVDTHVSSDAPLSPNDIDDIKKTTEEHAQRAMEQLRR